MQPVLQGMGKLPCTILFGSSFRNLYMGKLEVFGTAGCPYPREMRGWPGRKRRVCIIADGKSR